MFGFLGFYVRNLECVLIRVLDGTSLVIRTHLVDVGLDVGFFWDVMDGECVGEL